MDALEVVFKYASWPCAAVITILMFKTPLAKVFPAIGHVKAGGAEITLNQPQIATTPVPSITQTASKAGTDFEFGPCGKRVLAEWEKISEHDNDETKAAKLLKLAINGAVNNTYFRHYILLFGSQINLLEELNIISMTEEQIMEKFYLPLQSRFPDYYSKPEGTFENWLQFPINIELVEQKEGKVTITPFGKEFLMFVVAQNLNKKKGL